MADYDFASNLKAVSAIAPAVYDSDQSSSALDTSLYPFKALTLEIYVGVGGISFDSSDKIEFKLTHSDDDQTYAAVTDDDVVFAYPQLVGAGGIVKSLVAAHASPDITVVGYRGKKRYVQVTADFSGMHGIGTAIGVNWLMSSPMSAPTWQTAVPDMA